MTLHQTDMYNKKVKLTVSINITWMSRKNALELHILLYNISCNDHSVLRRPSQDESAGFMGSEYVLFEILD